MKKIIYIIITSILFFGCTEDKIDFEEYGIINGKIIESNSFDPIENAKVSISPSNNSTFTDENGEYEFLEISSGEYSIKAEKDGFITGYEPTTLKVNETISINIELDKSNALNKPPSAPNLLLPQDGSVDEAIEVTLSWSASEDVDNDEITYKIILRNDENEEIEYFDGILDTNYHLTNLNYGVKYFWQIEATDNINTAILSTVFSFETNQFPNNRFLFTRVVNGNNVIFSSNELGDEIMITSENENSWRPRKNTTANRIAFLRTYNSETHIFTMKYDGSDVKKVTSTVQPAAFKQSEIDFSWSTNGNKLIYANFDRLYIINKDGSGNYLLYQTDDGNLITECEWSFDSSFIALKTNNNSGYNVKIFTINFSGDVLATILENVNGAAGGLNISINNQKLLYTYDVSGFEDSSYRQLNTHLFMYDFNTGVSTDFSTYKVSGTNDLDPRFSPNEAKIIMVNTSSDGISEKKIFTLNINDPEIRNQLFSNAMMPDWE